jgi:antitoxin (DNA-binding transcriptional repressor) of toxin-antitoxin stability system
MIEVGVRVLKNRMGSYLAQVRQGQTIVVTDRGRPIARIERIDGAVDLPESLRHMISEGRVVDHGRPGPLETPRVSLSPGARSMVDYVRDQRR